MSKDKIICNGATYTSEAILSGSCFIGNSIAGDELAIDTLDVELHSLGANLTSLAYGTPVFYYHEDTLVGKFYLHDVSRTARDKYKVNCVSGVGLLDTPMHYGGLYTGETVTDVLTDIIGGIVPYTVSAGVGAVRVYGWLPVATRRENLKQLLFATGASLKKDTAGEINIVLLKLDAPVEISDDRLFEGGTVEYQSAVSDVVVLEHGYIITPSDEEATLFDEGVVGQELISPQGVAMNGVIVTFNGPMHDVTATGGAILEQGINYAVLAPSGQTTLKGKKYTHTTREVHAAAESITSEKNVARVEDATLVNITNSEAVAKRVANFYSVSRTIKADMVMGPERPGDAVALNDPFDERAVALLMSQDINMSNVLVARAELVAGYTPVHDDIYEHVVVLTGTGTWTVPDGVKKIRVVLIGSGSGGAAGENGEPGEGTEISIKPSENRPGFTKTIPPGKGGDGGSGGIGGAGGKIFQKRLEVLCGQTFNYMTPDGGTGGKSDGEMGADGADTIFGALTSEAGSRSTSGYVDVLTGYMYGAPGLIGVCGGRGGDGGNYYEKGKDGEPAGDYLGGVGRNPSEGGTSGNLYNVYFGGIGGGGGAYGFIFGESEYQASGADAMIPAQAKNYGCGGNGGNGGGGGSGGGGGYIKYNKEDTWTGIIRVSGWGRNGTGSAGTDGAPGCIIIYY